MAADDPHAFVATLARTHGERLRRFLTRRVRNLADIPDIVQEVYLRLLRIRDRDAIRSPEAYLFTVAAHVAQQHAMSEMTAPVSIDANDFLAQLQATNVDPALEVSAQQSLEGWLLALERLSPKVRATFVLHRHYGLTIKEIADTLSISVPMAKKHLVKALLHFRQHVDGT